MIISVFPNLNNKGVSVLAVNVVNKLISGGAEVYLSEEHEAVFTETKAKFETFDKAMSISLKKRLFWANRHSVSMPAGWAL